MISPLHPFAGHRSVMVPSVAVRPMATSPATTGPAATATEPASDGVLSSSESDLLSLSDPRTLESSAVSQQSMSLRMRSHLRVSQSEDGQLAVRSHSRLRFTYDFEAADGTQIRVRAKVDMRYLQTTDDNSQSYSLKLRAKAQVSILQQDVSQGVGSLLETPERSSASQESIAQALEMFQQVVDSVTSSFLESNPLDGDQLITGIVDAFNALVTSVGSPVPALPAQPPAEPVENQLEPPVLIGGVPNDLPESQPSSNEGTAPANVVAEPPSEAALQASAADTASTAEGADGTPDATAAGELPAEDSQLSGTGESENADPPEATAATAAPAAWTSASEVMLNVRLKVVQSLTTLVGVFNNDSSSTTISQSSFRASVQLMARYSSVTENANSLLPPDEGIDAQA